MIIKVSGKPHFRCERGVWNMYNALGVISRASSIKLAYSMHMQIQKSTYSKMSHYVKLS